MKKIYSLFAAITLAMSSFAATYTCYFGVPSGGTYTPYVWVATSNWTVISSPEHTAMSLLGMNGTTTIYKYQITTDQEPHYLIFTTNNGWENQSGNVIAANGGYYEGGTEGCQSTNLTATLIYGSDNAALGLAPAVALSPNVDNVLEGETITLTATPEHFSGTPAYTYSYSTDEGLNWTAMAGNTMVAGTSGTTYKFKVVATYNAEEAEATTYVHVIVCTVAGSDSRFNDIVSNAFGSYFDATDTNNDMTYNAETGIFSLTKNNVYLPAYDLKYKVVVNHSWDIEYPSGNGNNQTTAIAAEGFYNLTFTFNWSTKAVGCTATYLYPAVVSIAHSQDSYVAHNIAYDSEAGNYHTSLHLVPRETATEFLFYVSRAETVYLKNNGIMTRLYNQNWIFAEGVVNAKIDVDVEGDYVFTFNPENNSVSVDYPNFKRTVGTNYISLCLPYAVSTLSNATAYQISATNQDAVVISSVDLPLDAGKPYIIKPTAAGEIEATFQNVGEKATTPVNNGILRGNLSATPIVLNPNDVGYFFYILSGNEIKLVVEGEPGDEVTVGQYRAYAAVPKFSLGAPVYRIIEAGNEATNIQNVEGNEAAVKFIENGKLFIMKNGVVYNVTGAVVK